MPATLANVALLSYLPVLLVISMAVVFVIANIVGSAVIGPQKAGAIKGITYESGMDPIGSTKKRFNVRFYMMAMTFLVFDVEIIFLYPWAVNFKELGLLGFVEMVLFIGFVLAGFFYVIKKGALKWE